MNSDKENGSSGDLGGSQKIKALDGLRGLAALQVVFYHFMFSFMPMLANGLYCKTSYAWEYPLRHSHLFIYNGRFSVCIFFILSGYVLTKDFFVTRKSRIITRRALGRMIRLGIPACFSILVVFVLLYFKLYHNLEVKQFLGFSITGDQERFAHAFEAQNLFNNLFITTWFCPADEKIMYNFVLWTMPIELWGSFLVFSLALIFHRCRHLTLIYTFIALIFLLINWHYHLRATFIPIYMALFAIGSLLSAKKIGKKSEFMNLIVLGLGYYLGCSEEELYYPLGAFLILYALLSSTFFPKLLEGSFYLYLGRISFPLYLIHQIVIFSLISKIYLVMMSKNLPLGINLFTCLTATLLVSVALAHLMEDWVDAPARKLASRFAYWLCPKEEEVNSV